MCFVYIEKEFELNKIRIIKIDYEQGDYEKFVVYFCNILVMYMGECSFLFVKYVDNICKLYFLNKGKYVLKVLLKLNCFE